MFMQHHNDTIIKTHEGRTQEGRTQEDFFTNIFTSHFIARVRKGCSRFACERVVETEHKLHILTSTPYDRHVVSFLFSWCWGQLHRVFRGPLGRVWPSLPHLVSNSQEVCWQLLWHPTQLNYKIIQRPHNRLLDLWNQMFNRHQAETTVMQFTGHSLPVHHWSGTFTLSHIISRAHMRDFFRLLAIGMCHIRYLRNCRCDHHRAEITIMQFIGQSLPVHHFFAAQWEFLPCLIFWAKLYFTLQDSWKVVSI